MGQLARLAADILLSGNGKLAAALYDECIAHCAKPLLTMKNNLLVAALRADPPLKEINDDYLTTHKDRGAHDIFLKVASLHFTTFKDAPTARAILSAALQPTSQKVGSKSL